jgi:hypothetical protein
MVLLPDLWQRRRFPAARHTPTGLDVEHLLCPVAVDERSLFPDQAPHTHLFLNLTRLASRRLARAGYLCYHDDVIACGYGYLAAPEQWWMAAGLYWKEAEQAEKNKWEVRRDRATSFWQDRPYE